MRIVLISAYELGRQPFGIASPAAWLRADGHEVVPVDLSIETLPPGPIREADLVALYLPMHTATRLAIPAIARIRVLNPQAHLCCYGLYAPLNEEHLRALGVSTILGGEFEAGLLSLTRRPLALSQREPLISLERLRFVPPDRSGLPALARYAGIQFDGIVRRAGYTESSRGCKHLCRHCPVVPVYNGVFRVVQQDVVLEDIRRQVRAGAQHITFGDPDFWNGPSHARRILEAMHQEHPGVSYDVTIKIEHLLANRAMLPLLKKTGCLFVTSAAESIDDEVLAKLDKGHTRADFIEVVHLFKEMGLTLAPTFIPFTPWTTRESYCELLRVLLDLDLVDSVSPVQLALRLLITSGSRLLELDDIRRVTGPFDQTALVYRWEHADSAVDHLAAGILRIANAAQKTNQPRRETFREIWELAHEAPMYQDFGIMPRAAVPYLNEPWYC
ncbi:MAG TPA: CUAEP/CCAEP-tail radical SAM protein [Bryobacteraceae bacterium]|nr:CUAEP/CCAEP-tail radical SAM protein [Bryobacteraceae bacterium]